MKRIGATLFFLIAAVTSALPATITSQLLDPWGRSNTTTLTWKLKGAYAIPPNVTYTDVRAFVATNGTFSAAIGAGNYDLQVGPRNDLYAVTVPGGAGTYDLSTLITNAITFPYVASPQYVQKAGDVMAGNLSFASSSYGGFILNSLTTAQRLALTPTNGMIVYDATISTPFIYTSGGWSNALTAYAPSLWLSDTNAMATGIASRSIATFNGKGSNNVFFASTNYGIVVANTNYFWHPTDTVTGANGANVVSISGGTFATNHVGDYIIVTNSTDTTQLQIVGFVDTTHAIVYPKVGQYNPPSFTSSGWECFPNAVYYPDNTGGNPAGFVGNDGSVGISGQYGSHNTGQLLFINNFNTVAQSVYKGIGPQTGTNFQANFAWGITGIGNWTPSFYVSTVATYGVGGIRDDSHVDWTQPFTNSTGNAFQIDTALKLGGSTVATPTLTLTSTNVVLSGVATVSGTNGFSILVGSAGAFSAVTPGCKIGISSGGYNEYTVLSNSTTVAYVLEQLQANYSSATFQVGYPNAAWNNATPALAGGITQDGSLMLKSPTVGGTPKLILNNGGWTSNSVYMRVNQEAGSLSFLEFQSAGGNGPLALFSVNAPSTAIRLDPTGSLNLRYALTNDLGNVAISTNLSFIYPGSTIILKTGTNAKIGTATATGASAVTVSTTAVTANSLIFLTIQTPGGTPGAPYISAVTPGTSFSFKSVAGDTSTVGWVIMEKN